MVRKLIAVMLCAWLSACASLPDPGRPTAPFSVKIIAFNDFHGTLEPSGSTIATTGPTGEPVRVAAGGAAHLAAAVDRLKQQNSNHIVVSAGDLISASPFASSQFLDEPAILAMNLIGLDLNAVGNHEFDRGPAELLRMQQGGCAKHTLRQPCRLDEDFPGARFNFLAANVRQADGETLFPATSIRSFGAGPSAVKIAFIGLTLKETPTLVVPASVAGLDFGDEADTINALVPALKAQGAAAVVVLIHQGLSTKVGYNDKSCGGVDGNLLPILARLDPAVDLVVSGHTHNAYICDHAAIDPSRRFLVTSASYRGMMLTDIDLTFDGGRLVRKTADNLIVASSGPASAPVQALVDRYVAAAKPIADRVVGRLTGPALRATLPSGESVLGSLVADAQRQAVGAEIAFMNQYGLRADLAAGPITYGQLYSVLPFGNIVQLKGLTGRQIRAVLEQQFASGSNSLERPNWLQVSQGFSYTHDLSQPEGRRVSNLRLNGAPLADDRIYRVAVSNFLATGGDNFTIFRSGSDISTAGPEDVDALESYFSTVPSRDPPTPERINLVGTFTR
jgi:5'-nucleotidase